MSPGAWIVLGALLVAIAIASLLNGIDVILGSSYSVAGGQSEQAAFAEAIIGAALFGFGGFYCIQRGRKALPKKKDE